MWVGHSEIVESHLKTICSELMNGRLMVPFWFKNKLQLGKDIIQNGGLNTDSGKSHLLKPLLHCI